MKVYKTHIGFKIFGLLFSLPLIIVCSGILLVPFIPVPKNTIMAEMQNSWPPPGYLFYLIPICLLIIVLLAFMILIATFRKKAIITESSAIVTNVFITKKIEFKEVEDVYVEFFNLCFETKNKKKICLNLIGLKSLDLEENLHEKFKNLDVQKIEDLKEKFQDEEQEIFKNNEFGFSIEDRKSKLRKARLIAGVLNGAGVLITLWTFFFPNPYKYAIIACIALPLVAIIVIKFSKGLIKIDAEKGSAYPSAFGAISPGMILALRAMLDYSIDDYSNIWIPAILIAIIFTALLIIGNKEFSFKNGKEYFRILSSFVFAFACGYGVVVTTNCTFDESKPEMFASEVVGKEIGGGRKRTSYDLKLSPWGNKVESEKVSVDSDLYNNLQIGDEVSVYRFKGKFDIPWIVVDYAR